MQRLGWMVALVVVAVACGTGADMMGEILDSGVPDADAQTGDCLQGPVGPQGATGAQGPQGPVGPQGPPAQAVQFVGRSTQTLQGSQGVLAFSQACQTDFGPGHRVCTSEEVLNTTDLPGLTGDPSWARPSFVPVGGGSIAVFVDMSGAISSSSSIQLTCDGWNDASSSRTGLTVDAGGSFELLGCNGARTIACCGPK